MAFAYKCMLKPVSMATNGFPTSLAASKASLSHPHISIPFRPIKFHISCTHSATIPLSLKTKEPILRVSVIAAQQEAGGPFLLEEQGGGVLNWDEGLNSEGGSGERDELVEPSEEAKLYIIANRETGQSRGFGFVTMSTVEEADKAVEMFHRYDLNGRLLTVNKAARKGLRPSRQVYEPSNRIYVGNLPWSVDNARLEELFSEYGKVLSARVVIDRETERSRGFGFVVMSSAAEMNDAITNLDGQNLDSRAIRVNAAAVRPARGGF